MAKLWRFLAGAIVLAVCLGLVLAPGLVLAEEKDCGIEIEPALTKVGFNQDFTVNVTVNNPTAQPLDCVMCHINFTASLLSVTSVDYGTTVGSPFTFGLAPPTWDNATGWIDYDDGCPLGTSTNLTSVVYATIHMKSKAASGVATLEFVPVDGQDDPETCLLFAGPDYLNWTMVVNGTVNVGVPLTFSISPDSLTFNAIEGGENPPDQTLEVCNTGVDTMDWSLTDNAGWLSETPTSASLGEGKCEDVTVSVDVTGMEPGDYSATITITGSDEVRVPVSLHIESAMVPIPGGPANLSASSLSISPQQVKPGQEVTISINVANTGGETGSYNAVLYINGAVEDSQSVSVAGGTSKNVIFTVTKSKAGVYDVSLAGQSGQFEVVGGGGWFGGGLGLGTGGIIAIVVIVIVLILALVFILRGTAKPE